jgi:hypothetical protein
MHRIDDSPFLLFIEPPAEEKAAAPVSDELTRIMTIALHEGKHGTSNYDIPGAKPVFRYGCGYKGYHRTACGERSDGIDYFLENGMVTHNLSVFYLSWYRNSIPESEMNKLNRLADHYRKKYSEDLNKRFEKVEADSKKDLMTRIEEWFNEDHETV